VANLKQLADMLGISQTTVSRALNGYPEVSEATRKRVMQAARQYKYAPNPSARGLATGKARTIGHVIPLSIHEMINPHFSDFVAGAGHVYQERGYDMLISVTSEADEAEAYRKLKRDKRVDGVIMHGPLADDPRIALLQSLDIPFVVHGRTLDTSAGYSWVDVNNMRSFREATRHMIELGHERIALINGLDHMVFAIRRRDGFLQAMATAGLEPDRAIMASGDMTEPFGYSEMRNFLKDDNPPTAVLCASMLPAMGALRAIQEAGMVVGRDMSIIAHDDCLSFLMSDMGEITMTVTRSPIIEAGKICATMLIDKIEGRDAPDHILLEAEFRTGTTTGPPPP
jgi:LacI family transcriptional regulator